MPAGLGTFDVGKTSNGSMGISYASVNTTGANGATGATSGQDSQVQNKDNKDQNKSLFDQVKSGQKLLDQCTFMSMCQQEDNKDGNVDGQFNDKSFIDTLKEQYKNMDIAGWFNNYLAKFSKDTKTNTNNSDSSVSNSPKKSSGSGKSYSASNDDSYVASSKGSSGSSSATSADSNYTPTMSSNATGTYEAKATSYYPANNALEGGFQDRKGNKLYTLQDYLAGKAPYVSVAMDSNAFQYGQKLQIPELEKKYGRSIEFRVVDTGGAFKGKGTSRIDICSSSEKDSLDPTLNGKLTLIAHS